MYEKFERLCKEKGITPYKVSRDTGIATATLSDWKSGRSKPKVDKLKILADYFGVPIEYFLE
ncbi:helix-turn-helix transcriptional regulator [Hungatella sp.]|uniref:helix-turn-helix domain-containing protein n=1 Tax=Hungatella sp. TaxID=2613924 RepID=UPI002A803B9D|nr:helix-turn-helix transcriptional regulator [Hungatella sp.]